MRSLHLLTARGFLLPLILSLLFAPAAGATRIDVPGDLPSIQAAIDQALPGDSVVVAAGSYQEQIDFLGKSIVLLGAGDLVTAIDGAGALGSVVTFSGGEGPGTTLEGFTITGGSGNVYHSGMHGGDSRAGGGIYVNPGAVVTIRNCAVRGNRVTEGYTRGGGIYSDSAQLMIDNCRVRFNEAQGGGGLKINGGSVEIKQSWIDGNTGSGCYAEYASSVTVDSTTFSANQDGRGLSVVDGSLSLTSSTIRDNVSYYGEVGLQLIAADFTVSNCTIRDNIATSGGALGGGIGISNSTGTITNCEIIGNRLTGYGSNFGGGVYLGGRNTDVVIRDCVIEDNDAGATSGLGGGVAWFDHPTVSLRNCTIRGNHAGRRGGAVYCENAPATVVNCRLDENVGEELGGAVYASLGAELTLSGCSLARNLAATGGAIGNASFGGGAIFVSHCTLAQNRASTAGALWSAGEPLTVIDSILWGNGEGQIGGNGITVTYSDVGGGWSGTGNIDADPLFCDAECELNDLGLAAASPCLGADHEGGDMGAFGLACDIPLEHSPSNWSIPEDFPTIAEAIAAACEGDTLTIAPGTYAEDGFSLDVHSLHLRGTDPEDWAVVESTVLQAGNDVDLFSVHAGFSSLSGLTLSGGMSGIDLGGATLSLDHCLLRDAYDYGIRAVDATLTCSDLRLENAHYRAIDFDSGALTLLDSEIRDSDSDAVRVTGATLVMEHTVLENNHFDGMYLQDVVSAEISDCSFTGNGDGVSIHGGGAIHLRRCVSSNNGSSGLNLFAATGVTAEACTFEGNSFSGIAAWQGSMPLIRASLVLANSAWGGAGAQVHDGSSVRFENCTFTGNVAYGEAGAVRCDGADATLVNCILWNNSPAEIVLAGGGTLTATYSDIHGGWPGTGNIDLDPLFGTYAGHDYLLGPASPAIDAGDPATQDAISDWHPRWPDWHQDAPAADLGAYGGEFNGLWIH